MRAQQRCQHTQRRSQNVGHYGLVTADGLVGQAGLQLHVIGLGIGAGRFHGSLVNINRINSERAKLGRPNCQNARSAAVVEHAAQRFAGSALAGNPAQAHACGRVRAGAKSQARIKPDHLPGLRRRLVPRRHNPEFRRDLDRCELRLRQPHPVLLGHGLNRDQLATGKEILQRQQGSGILRQGFGGKQRHDARTLPAGLGRRHARLAKQRLLSRRVGVGVFD